MQSSKYWVFDLDGTLVDSISHYFNTLRGLFTHFNVPFTEKDLQKSLTMNSRHYLSHYLVPEQIEYAVKEVQRQSEDDSKHIQTFAGVKNLLDHLKTQGAKLAVWTGRDLTSASMILKHTELHSYFDLCVGGTCVANHKPHPEGLHRIIKHWDCDPKSVVMVGDHDVDMLGSKESNTYAIRVSWNQATPPNCNISDLHFRNVEQFEKWLRLEK